MIDHCVEQAVKGYNTHHGTDLDVEELTAPILEKYSAFGSFEEMKKAYAGRELKEFDTFIRKSVNHPGVKDLHSFLTVSMDAHKEE